MGQIQDPSSHEISREIVRKILVSVKFVSAILGPEMAAPILWTGGIFGRRIFIHHQCWEVLPFCRFQRQRCIKIRAQDFYIPLALKTAKGQHLPALVVYKNLSPNFGFFGGECRFYFYGRADFSEIVLAHSSHLTARQTIT